jgi:hypothetical protein
VAERRPRAQVPLAAPQQGPRLARAALRERLAEVKAAALELGLELGPARLSQQALASVAAMAEAWA